MGEGDNFTAISKKLKHHLKLKISVRFLSVLLVLVLLSCISMYFVFLFEVLSQSGANATDFSLKVEQKLAGLEGHLDRQKQGGAGSDRDSIRASILDEAVIVCS